MDTIFGFVGADFALLGADRSTNFSIVRLTDTEDKIFSLDNNKLLATAGDPNLRSDFGSLMQKNVHLYHLRNGVKLSTHGTANFIRTTVAEGLRKSPSYTDMLLAGFDESGPSLYYLDYLGVVQKIRVGSHGHAGSFILGLLDNWWGPNITLDEAKEIAKKCVNEVKTRFLVAQPEFIIKVVDRNGITELDLSA
ncbi:PSMB2_1 [Blepharisma stoltei]|uniref:Proteasome subunit beta n=1 Tax=Blepharisma stoltei TaxID=1481888 RepID=A0AAU9IJK3_9CILI|nr:unnamed protein product [Blepharisma stoltei]